jgi:dephospho-CoA kinase
MLRDRGAITFSADEAARAVLTEFGNTAREICQAFGAGALSATGGIDRVFIGKRIFSDPKARETLNRIMHPRIRRLLADQIRSAQEDFLPPQLIVVEIPLLYEGKLESWFERIVVVTASETVQAERLMVRGGLTYFEAKARIASQLPTAEKAARATYVVVNDMSERELTPQVDEVWCKLNTSQACN